MSFSIRSETAARLLNTMGVEDLKQPGAVDRAIDLVESDGKLTAEERTALKGVLKTFQESGFDAESTTRLQAFLGLANAGVRHAFATGNSDDRVIDLADANKIVDTMMKDGKISGTERMTARAAMIAFKTTTPAREKLESAVAEAPVSGAFGDITLKDAGLRNTLRGFSGVSTLGAPQIQALLASAADGTGIANTERQDLTNLFQKHGDRIDRAGKALLAQALGIPFSVAGLDQAPVGTTPIKMYQTDFRKDVNLDFRKDANGTMQVRVNPATTRDYGWMDVKSDGTFGTSGRKDTNWRNEWDEWNVGGKVTFANGAFTAELDIKDVWHRTRPEGASDTPNWNSGNRIPTQHNWGGVFRTSNHEANGGAQILSGSVSRGNGREAEVVFFKDASGMSIQLQEDAYSMRIPVGADGTINYGQFTGKLGADGSLSLTSTTQFTRDYTERVSWTGSIPGATLN